MLRKILTQLECKRGRNPNLQAKILESLYEQKPQSKNFFFYWASVAVFSFTLLGIFYTTMGKENVIPQVNGLSLLNQWNEVMQGTAFGPDQVVYIKKNTQIVEFGENEWEILEIWTDGERYASRREEIEAYQVTLTLPEGNGRYENYEFNAPSPSTKCLEASEETCVYTYSEFEADGEDLDGFNLSIPEEILQCLEQAQCTYIKNNSTLNISSNTREDSLDGQAMTVVILTKERVTKTGKVSVEVEEYWFNVEGIPVQIVQIEEGNQSIETFEIAALDFAEAPLTLSTWEESLLGENATIPKTEE